MAGPNNNLSSVPISFEKGLFEGQEDSLCPPGTAVTLENWVPESNGALRVRRPWIFASTTSAPATRKARGIGRYPKPQGFETPAFVTSATASVATPQPVVTITQGTAGSFMVAVIGINGAGITVVGPDVSASTLMSEGWVRAGYQDNITNSQRIEYWYRLNIPGSAGTTVRFELSGTPTLARLHVLEVSNVATVGAVDRMAGTYSTTTTVTPGSGTAKMTRVPSEFVIAAIWTSANATFSAPTNSFTERTDTAGASGSMATFTKAVTAIGTQSMTATTSVTGTYTGAMLTLKAKQSTTEVSGGYVFAAHDNTTDYSIRYLDDTNLAAGTWVTAEAVTVSSTSRYVRFASGFGFIFYSSPQFTTVRCYDGTAATAITQAPPGRAIAVHRNILFSGGTFQDASRLYFSDIGDFATFGVNNYIDVEGAGGIEDIEPFQGGLLIGKPSSLHFLTGAGRDTFEVEKLAGGGAAPGKSIVATPYGAIIASTSAVYMWAGSGVETISTPIEDSYAITGDFATVAYNDGTARICDEGTGVVYCFHIPTGKWWLEKTVNLTTDGPACVFGVNEKLYYGPQSSTTASLLNYRNEPGTARAKDPSGFTETFKAWTPEMWLTGPGMQATPRHLHIQYRNRGTNSAHTGIIVTPYYDGVAGTVLKGLNPVGGAQVSVIPAQATAGVYRIRMDCGEKRGINSIQFRFEQTVGSSETSLMDIERLDFDFDVQEAR